MNINTMMFAARDFSARRGASNEVWPEKNCRPEGCAEFGLWRRCSSVTAPLWGMRPPRASPQAKLGATNVIVFMFMTTKGFGREEHFRLVTSAATALATILELTLQRALGRAIANSTLC